MSPISARFRHMLENKDGNEHTPPKALYDDLESAYGSIAGNTMGAYSAAPSRTHLPQSHAASSRIDFPSTSPSPISDTTKVHLTTQPRKNCSSSCLRSPHPELDKKPSRDKTLLSETQPNLRFSSLSHGEGIQRYDYENPILHPGEDETKTPMNSSQVFVKYNGPAPFAPGKTYTDSQLSNQKSYPISTQFFHPLEHVTMPRGEAFDRMLKHEDVRLRGLIEDDTINNILKTYGNGTPDESQQDTQLPQKSSEDALESSEDALEDDVTIDSSDPSQGRIEHIDSTMHQKMAMTPASAHESAALAPMSNESHSVEDCALRLSYYRTSDTPNLDQYAWSPCPSDDGREEINPIPDESSLTKPGSHVQEDASDSNAVAPSTSNDTSDSIESYGNTQKLLRLESQNSSFRTASKSDQPNAVLTSVQHLNIAGDLHLLGQGRSLGERNVSVRSFGRISGIISDGASSRPISEIELVNSLSDLVKENLKVPSMSDKSSQSGFYGTGSQERGFARHLAASMVSRRTGDLVIDLGPGSSQTQSSSSQELPSVVIPGHKARAGFYKDPSSSLPSPVRAATPPGLFGRRATGYSGESADSQPFDLQPSDLRPPLVRNNSRLAKAAAAAGIKEDGRLGRAMATSAEQDWVTETDAKTSGGNAAAAHPRSSIGSSLADSSELDSRSTTDQTKQHQIHLQQSAMLQHPPHPRYNHSWSIHKNLQTGSLVFVPDYVSREGSRLPNVNANPQLRSFTNPGPSPEYQHPIPLSKAHLHPLSSSPQMTPSRIELRENDQSNKSTQQKRMERDLTRSDFSCITDEPDDGITDSVSYQAHGSISGAREVADVRLRSESELHQASQYASSAWLSTVSKDQSNEPSLPVRASSFAKMTVLGEKGNLTGTPEGTGAREVGSSLADASSPGANLSSTPAILASSPPYHGLSPTADESTPKSKSTNAVDLFHRFLGDSWPDFVGPRPHLFEDLSSSHQHDSFGYLNDRPDKKPGSGHDDSPSHQARARKVQKHVLLQDAAMTSNPSRAISTSNVTVQAKPLVSPARMFEAGSRDEPHVDWLKYLPATGRHARRRRSSSESERKTCQSPLVEKASGLQAASQVGHQKRRSAGTLLNRPHNKLHDVEIGANTPDLWKNTDHQREPFEQESLKLVVPPPPSRPINTISSTSIVHRPPPGPQFPRDGALRRPASAGNPYARPIASNTSPHLYHIPGKPDAAMTTQRLYYSRMWAIVCILCPFLGPLYGHGFLDGIMAWQSDGVIQGFRQQEKIAVLVYSYTFFGAVLIGLAVAMILVAR